MESLTPKVHITGIQFEERQSDLPILTFTYFIN